VNKYFHKVILITAAIFKIYHGENKLTFFIGGVMVSVLPSSAVDRGFES
jgi:hypothetical protein